MASEEEEVTEVEDSEAEEVASEAEAETEVEDSVVEEDPEEAEEDSLARLPTEEALWASRERDRCCEEGRQ